MSGQTFTGLQEAAQHVAGIAGRARPGTAVLSQPARETGAVQLERQNSAGSNDNRPLCNLLFTHEPLGKPEIPSRDRRLCGKRKYKRIYTRQAFGVM